MKKHLLIAATLFAVTAPVFVRAQQPPIIDRKLFFGEIEIAGAQISPDGQYLSFPEALQGHAQHLGEEGRRAVQRGAAR